MPKTLLLIKTINPKNIIHSQLKLTKESSKHKDNMIIIKGVRARWIKWKSSKTRITLTSIKINRHRILTIQVMMEMDNNNNMRGGSM